MKRIARMGELGISHRAAASALKITPSVFSRFMLSGHATAMLGSDFGSTVDAYIDKVAAAGIGNYKTQPIQGLFFTAAASTREIAAILEVEFATVKRGIFHGEWPNEDLYKKVRHWIEQRIEKRNGGKIMLTRKSLPSEVLEFFGLKRDPFNQEMTGPDAFFEMREGRQVEKQVIHTIETAGWNAVTGAPGSGKSTLIRRIKTRVANMPQKKIVLIEPRTLEKQNLGASHLCDSILEDLGAALPSGRGTLEHRARRVARVLEQAHIDGKKPALLIDEAHLLSPQALLVLKRLYEIELDYQKLLAIILIGQERLAQVLKNNFSITEVGQRVDLIELKGLNGSLGLYVQYKLERAGCSKELFDPGAIRAIGSRYSTPLSVNNACAAAMIYAHDVGDRQITGDLIENMVG